MLTVRDFIYVDLERLKSLYSQVFSGVVDRVVQTEIAELEACESQEGARLFGGSTVAERVAEASHKTESRILYDHMYNLLENRLAETIVDATSLSPSNYVDELEQAFMVKVAGIAEVADYGRINTVLDKFNDIADAVHYMSSMEQRKELEGAKREIWAKIKQEKDRERKATMSARMSEIKEQLEQEAPFRLDDALPEKFSLITEMFYGDRIEVTIQPSQSSNLLFRGVLDSQWLRVVPGFLRALYGSYPAADWTMVGHLTYFADNPALDESGGTTVDSETGGDHDSASEPEVPAMRDAYRQLLSAYQGLERIYSKSAEFIEVIIWPLAIYRENELPELEADLDDAHSE